MGENINQLKFQPFCCSSEGPLCQKKLNLKPNSMSPNLFAPRQLYKWILFSFITCPLISSSVRCWVKRMVQRIHWNGPATAKLVYFCLTQLFPSLVMFSTPTFYFQFFSSINIFFGGDRSNQSFGPKSRFPKYRVCRHSSLSLSLPVLWKQSWDLRKILFDEFVNQLPL